MENINQLQEIQARKDKLIAQQMALSEQLILVRQEEVELQRIGRLEGLKQIGELIQTYKIPKHEIVNLYSELNIVLARGRPSSGVIKKVEEEVPVNNPILEDVTHNQEVANRFTKLYTSGMLPALLEEAKKCANLERVLVLTSPELEEYILENI